MEKRPQEEVQEQEVCNIHTLGQQQVQRYEEDRYAQNRHHHHPYTHTRTKQLVMEMILIGQERVTMITKAMKHHTDCLLYTSQTSHGLASFATIPQRG